MEPVLVSKRYASATYSYRGYTIEHYIVGSNGFFLDNNWIGSTLNEAIAYIAKLPSNEPIAQQMYEEMWDI